MTMVLVLVLMTREGKLDTLIAVAMRRKIS
jgi:hypothetical protein